MISRLLFLLSVCGLALFFFTVSTDIPSPQTKVAAPSGGLGQKRFFDHKHIYLPCKTGPRKILLRSQLSELLLTDKAKKIALFETMQGVECWIQEQKIESDPSMQIVRYLEAAQAEFDYETSTLSAKGVTAKRYQTSSDSIPGIVEQVLLEGSVDTLYIPLDDSRETPLEARHVTATLYSGPSMTLKSGKLWYANDDLMLSEGVELEHPFGKTKAERLELKLSKNHAGFSKLIAEENVELQDKAGNLLMADQLIFDAAANCCLFSQPIGYLEQGLSFTGQLLTAEPGLEHFTLEGNVAVWQRDKLRFTGDKLQLSFGQELETLELKGNVEIQRQNPGYPYVLADRLSYDPKKQKLQLFAKEGERVLFYDPEQGLTVSAATLCLNHDLENRLREISSSGVVRFHFEERELLRLKQHFSLREKN